MFVCMMCVCVCVCVCVSSSGGVEVRGCGALAVPGLVSALMFVCILGETKR